MFDAAKGRAIIEHINSIPVVETLGMRIETFEEGFCRAIVPRRHDLDGVYRSYHGGMLTLAADSVACFAILTMTPIDEVLTTTDIHIRFLAPCLSDAIVEARVVKLGRTLCPVHVDLYDEEGRHVAGSQVTYMRLPKRPSHAD
ncbi:MAG: PaaI family thioesterase [Phycisphaerae bacterium]